MADLAQDHCPLLAPPVEAVKDPGRPLDSFPAVTMIVCRYGPVPSRLDGTATVTTPKTVDSWRRRFVALPVVPPGNYPCPYDDGSALIIGFLNSTHDGVVVRMPLRGCRFATIGAGLHSTDGAFRSDLLRLVTR
jgi:hypothetical protein